MPRRTINAAELFDSVAIDLWGTLFEFKEMTLSLEERIADDWAAMEASDKSLKEELPQVLAFIDLFLEPTRSGAKGQGKEIKPSAVIKDLLKKDKIGMTHVMAIARELLTRGTDRPS
jgi:phosphopantetheinyl transferase (holo-ACP synthase)